MSLVTELIGYITNWDASDMSVKLAGGTVVMRIIGAVVFMAAGLSLNAGTVRAANSAAGVPAAAANITALDRDAVRNGLAPPEILKYDAQLEALAAQAPEIQARQDAVRAHAWVRRYNAIMAARDHVSKKFAAKSIARNNAIAKGLGGGHPNPCLDAMGRNTCGGNTASSSGGVSPILKGLFFGGGNGGDVPHLCGPGESPSTYGQNGEPLC